MLTPGMYEGFRLPEGRVPKRVAGNAVQRENDWLNDETYLSYMWRLYDLAVSVFEWKNLPKGVNERMVERWLWRTACACSCTTRPSRKTPNSARRRDTPC